MATLDHDGARLHYDCSGSGDATLAFFHGWCSKLDHWDAQATAFAPTHRIVRWDRRGMGASPAAPAAGPQRHAEDLAAILDVNGIERAVVVGHAGGGPGALHFAADHPERTEALVMVDTTVNRPGDERSDRFVAGVRRSAETLRGPDALPTLATMYRGFFGPRADAAVVEDAIATATATPLEVVVAELLHMTGDLAAVAARVRCPVLWVSAQPADTAAVRAAFTATTPVVGHVVGSGHFVQLEVPDQLNAMMAAFLADLPEA